MIEKFNDPIISKSGLTLSIDPIDHLREEVETTKFDNPSVKDLLLEYCDLLEAFKDLIEEGDLALSDWILGNHLIFPSKAFCLSPAWIDLRAMWQECSNDMDSSSDLRQVANRSGLRQTISQMEKEVKWRREVGSMVETFNFHLHKINKTKGVESVVEKGERVMVEGREVLKLLGLNLKLEDEMDEIEMKEEEEETINPWKKLGDYVQNCISYFLTFPKKFDLNCYCLEDLPSFSLYLTSSSSSSHSRSFHPLTQEVYDLSLLTLEMSFLG